MGGPVFLRAVRRLLPLVLPALVLPALILPALVLSGSPAAAGPQSPTGEIIACLARADRMGTDPHTCIGIVSKPCLEQAEDPSTAGMVGCIDREHVVWDGLLNTTYQILVRHLEPEKAEALRVLQRSWIKTRELTCGFYRVYYEGTMATPMEADCINRHTAQRFLYLEAFAFDLTGTHFPPR